MTQLFDASRRTTGTLPLQSPPGAAPAAAPPAPAAETPAPAAPPAARAPGTAPLVADNSTVHKSWFGSQLHGVIDGAADLAHWTADEAGTLGGQGLRGLGQAGGAIARVVGAPETARSIESGAATAGAVVDSTAHQAGNIVGSTGHMLGRGAEAGVDLAVDLANDPSGTIQREAGRLLDSSLGRPVPAYQQSEKVTGFVSEVTTRLLPGHGAFITGSAGVTLPAQTVATALTLGLGGEAVPNVSLSLQATAAAERLTDGRVRVVVSMRSQQSASWDVGFGINAGVERNGQTLAGVRVGASASVSVGASESGQVELIFDPRDAGDAARLSSLFGSHAVPPSATVEPAGLADAFQHNMQSVTMGATLGAQLGLRVEAQVGVANTRTDDVRPDRQAPEVVSGQALGLTGSATVQATDTRTRTQAVAGLGVDGANASIGARGALGGVAGGAFTQRRDGSTQTMGFVALNADASARGSLPLLPDQSVNLLRGALRAATGEERNVDEMASIKVDTGPDGQVRAAAIELTHRDAHGRTVEVGNGQEGVNHLRATEGFESTRIELTATGLAALRATGATPTPATIAQLMSNPANFIVRPPVVAAASATTYGGHFQANLGIGKVDLSAAGGAGHYQVSGDMNLDMRQRELLTGQK